MWNSKISESCCLFRSKTPCCGHGCYVPQHDSQALQWRPQAAFKLQQPGVISYARGLIKALDRPKLEALSCECYEVVKKDTDQLLHYMPQRQVITHPDIIPTVALAAP